MEPLYVWVIYFDPKDFPGKYVVRKHQVTNLSAPTGEFYVKDSLHEARMAIPGIGALFRVERSPTDDSVIVESWL